MDPTNLMIFFKISEKISTWTILGKSHDFHQIFQK